MDEFRQATPDDPAPSPSPTDAVQKGFQHTLLYVGVVLLAIALGVWAISAMLGGDEAFDEPDALYVDEPLDPDAPIDEDTDDIGSIQPDGTIDD
jgi:hypothetical protein